MDAPEDLIVARPQPGVLLLTLNRPAVRNALRTQTLREMATILGDAASDDDVRAVVLTGGLAFFAAGADVREMATLGIVDILLHERQRHWRALATFPSR